MMYNGINDVICLVVRYTIFLLSNLQIQVFELRPFFLCNSKVFFEMTFQLVEDSNVRECAQEVICGSVDQQCGVIVFVDVHSWFLWTWEEAEFFKECLDC